MITAILRALKLGGGISSTVRLFLKVLREEGWQGVVWRFNVARRTSYVDEFNVSAKARVTDYNLGYSRWLSMNDGPVKTVMGHSNVLFSIILPVYRSNIAQLRDAIDSVIAQKFARWELCIADDGSGCAEISALLNEYASKDHRIRYVVRTVNGHISAASNSALDLATGDFAVLLDHDDLLHSEALGCIAEVLELYPKAELIYTDEDKVDLNGRRHHPYFKPKFNPVLMLAQNMISHLGIYRVSTLREIGGFRVGVEGAQDWDLAWRVIEIKGELDLIHVPRVLYHWREAQGSTARDIGAKDYAQDAQRRVVSDHIARIGRSATVTSLERLPGMLRVRYDLPTELPLISIIIPTRDRRDLLEQCIKSLYAKTDYNRFEVIVVDNGSVESDTLEYLSALEYEGRARVLKADIPFNYSRLNNLAVDVAKGCYVLMLNNDIEFTDPDWLSEMLSWAIQPETGCVGAKLWYPNGTLQHGGVILGVNGLAGHAHRGISKIDNGYAGRAVVAQNLSAVTGACMLVRRSIYLAVGGLDEAFAVAYNDIDFCLRVQDAGYKNVWTPYAEMVHHESATRGSDNVGEGRKRLDHEISLMRERWSVWIDDDPAYNPNLTKVDENFSIGVHRCDAWHRH